MWNSSTYERTWLWCYIYRLGDYIRVTKYRDMITNVQLIVSNRLAQQVFYRPPGLTGGRLQQPTVVGNCETNVLLDRVRLRRMHAGCWITLILTD